MCGILGIVGRDGWLPDPDRRSAALERLKRRGPDDAGQWLEGPIWLGHRRLAILDPSPAGHQPMESVDGRLVIVFNGEIYNHREVRQKLSPLLGWRSDSDTETLLEAYRRWGEDCLRHLNGMFAFAVWDRQQRSLFLARDRMGVKPLYYGATASGFAFGSRPGALEALLGTESLSSDPAAIRAYLELGYVPSPLSMHREIRKLPAGHFLRMDDAGTRVVRWWDFRSIAPELSWNGRTESDLVEELGELVREAVRARLISDVPLGAFLSAGVDSALVVAAMKSAGVERPRTFTIGFREPRYDESVEAARIAALVGTDHVTETLGVDELLALLPDCTREYDEPLADPSAFPTMAVSRLASRDVKVALTGDGGDELFGGYHYYGLVDRVAPWLRWPEGRRHALRRAASLLPAHRAKLLAGALGQSNPVTLFQYMRSINKDFPSLLSPDLTQDAPPASSYMEQYAASFAMDLSPAEIGMRLDAGFTLADGYLQKVDVASMAFSLEARCPLTDYRLVEWAMRLPVRYKLRGGHTKYLLRRALARHLPERIAMRPKTGFGMPVAAWLRGPLREWASSMIHDDSLMSSLPLDRAALRGLFDLHQRGTRDAHPLLWGALMLIGHTASRRSNAALPDVRPLRAA